MGRVGKHRKVKSNCGICGESFDEEILIFKTSNKTNAIELMCPNCTKTDGDGIQTEPESQEVSEEEVKELDNREMISPAECSCVKFPACGAIGFYQAEDDFTENNIKAYFIYAKNLDEQIYYAIDFCPFCGKRLYKK